MEFGTAVEPITGLIPRGDRALTLKQAEVLYGIPSSRLRQYRRERLLDFFRLGRAVFVSENSLISFLEARREPALVSGSPSRAASQL